MKSSPLLVFLILTAHLSAVDIGLPTFLPAAPSAWDQFSPQFGLVNPVFDTLHTDSCGAYLLMTGLTVHHDGTRVTGLAMRCRMFTEVGGTITSVSALSDRPLRGYSSTRSSLIECTSGKAVTGVRVRSGSSLDAVSISCASTIPLFSVVISYSGDPTFGTGRAARMDRSTVGAASDPVGGRGGSPASFDCQGVTFVQSMRTAVSFNQVDAMAVSCGGVVTQLVFNTNGLPDLITRTRGQQRRIGLLADLDTFSVDVFNVGRTVNNTGNSLYVDLIFSALDVQFTSVDAGCSYITQGRIRCPIASLAPTGLASFNFTHRALRQRPEAPIIVVQASYDVDDFNLANNTYGFATTVK